MAGEIVMDCGGSFRIKLLMAAGVGAMDDLLAVDPIPAAGLIPPNATGSQQLFSGKSFNTVNIVFIDPNGIATNRAVGGPVGTVQLISGDHNITGEQNGADFLLSLFSTGTRPFVDAKQHPDRSRRQRRRYEIANSGAISQISVNGANVPVPLGTVFTSVTLLP